jgi:hypothetical protein
MSNRAQRIMRVIEWVAAYPDNDEANLWHGYAGLRGMSKADQASAGDQAVALGLIERPLAPTASHSLALTPAGRAAIERYREWMEQNPPSPEPTGPAFFDFDPQAEWEDQDKSASTYAIQPALDQMVESARVEAGK